MQISGKQHSAKNSSSFYQPRAAWYNDGPRPSCCSSWGDLLLPFFPFDVRVIWIQFEITVRKYLNPLPLNLQPRFAKGVQDRWPEASNSTVNLTLITTVLGFPEIFQCPDAVQETTHFFSNLTSMCTFPERFLINLRSVWSDQTLSAFLISASTCDLVRSESEGYLLIL